MTEPRNMAASVPEQSRGVRGDAAATGGTGSRAQPRHARSSSPSQASQADPIAFIEEMLVNPETGRPFVLTGAERLFLRHAFDCHPDGRAVYPELVFGAPKKSGKSTLAALCLLYAVRALGQRFAEGCVASNSREQSANRVFLMAARIVEASPLLGRMPR